VPIGRVKESVFQKGTFMFPTDDNPTRVALRIRVETLIGRIGEDLETIKRQIEVLTQEQHPSFYKMTCFTPEMTPLNL
jgi:hypothetical protein